jgi:hypothetical protein
MVQAQESVVTAVNMGALDLVPGEHAESRCTWPGKGLREGGRSQEEGYESKPSQLARATPCRRNQQQLQEEKGRSEGPWPSFQACAARRLVREGLQKWAQSHLHDLREGRGKKGKGGRERIKGGRA